MENTLAVIGITLWLVGIVVVMRSAFHKNDNELEPVEAARKETAEERIERWNKQIDYNCALYVLDAELPEIQELRGMLEKFASGEEWQWRMIDLMVENVSPNFDVIHRNGVLYLYEGCVLHRILRPWTLVEYFYASMPVTKMIVSKFGMTMYSGDRVIAWVGAAAVDPHRFDDDHLRLENTVVIAKHYDPAMDIEVENLVGAYSAVFMKTGDEWSHHVSYDRQTAVIS